MIAMHLIHRFCPHAPLAGARMGKLWRARLTAWVAAASCASALAAGPATTGSPPAAASVPASATAAAQGPRVLRNLAYGTEARQQLDAYVPARPAGPVLVMVHGGAWVLGDKAEPGMIQPKAAYWTQQGYVVVSVNYRLVPKVRPHEQAEDVARALAFAQREAASWGADGRRVVLMGHSAGGHLVALLHANPAEAQRVGAHPWKGTVVLDSAALDLVSLMRAPHPRLYDRAFGTDPAYWERVSPFHAMQPKGPPPVLFICSQQRPDACPQADAYERKASEFKHRVTIWMQDKDHMQINRQLGQPGIYTDSVARWISSIL